MAAPGGCLPHCTRIHCPQWRDFMLALLVAGAALAFGLAALTPMSPGLLPERNLSGLPPYVILGIVVLLVVVFRVIPLLRQSSAGAEGARTNRSYGAGGAAVCSRCGLPFARSPLGINLVTGKLARCPHCGKWQVAGMAGPTALAAAEARLKASGPVAEGSGREEPVSAEERLRRQIEDSKYERPQ
jgi:hypothetical protein